MLLSDYYNYYYKYSLYYIISIYRFVIRDFHDLLSQFFILFYLITSEIKRRLWDKRRKSKLISSHLAAQRTCISFSLDFTLYTLTREYLQLTKIKVITNFMKNISKTIIIKTKIVNNIIIMHVNKYKKKVIYNKDNIIFLSSWNIKSIKSINKLKDKMLNLFQIKKLVDLFYQLKLSSLIKIHDVFYSNLLRKNAKNSLLNQIQKFSRLIVVSHEKK